LTFKQEYCNLS